MVLSIHALMNLFFDYEHLLVNDLQIMVLAENTKKRLTILPFFLLAGLKSRIALSCGIENEE